MATADTHPKRTAMALAVAALAIAQPAHAGYGWPVEPFHVQHPVRGFFGDPRVGTNADGSVSRQFHFGVDVSAPNGTPVYATLTGVARIHSLHRDVVLILAGSTEFSYWHVVPVVRDGACVVAYRTVIGRVEKPWAHVHFSERIGGVYVDPLRKGALTPYADRTAPAVGSISLDRAGGRVDLVAEVFDTTPLAVPAPWADKPVMPALVQWRLRGPAAAASGWRTAADFRRTIPAASLFASVYATGTTQNHASTRGRYRVYLSRGLDLATLSDGRYRVDVAVEDEHGNRTVASAAFVVRGHVLRPA